MRNLQRRKGYSLLECLVVMGLLTGLVAMAGSLATWSARYGRQATLRIAAAEAVANILEEGRAAGFAKLDDAWAASRTLPDSLRDQFPGSRLEVTVAAVPGENRLKRVTVSLELRTALSPQPRTIGMSTLVGRGGEAKP